MLQPSLQRHHRPPVANFHQLKSNQARHRHTVPPGSNPRLLSVASPLHLLRHAILLFKSKLEAYTTRTPLAASFQKFPTRPQPAIISPRSILFDPQGANLSDAPQPQPGSHLHQPAFRIDTYRVENVAVVECHGKLTFEHAPQLRNEVRNLLSAEKRIIIDMKHVQHMDSSGLGALATLYVSCRTRGCKLELINLSQATRSMLSMTNLLSLFEEAGRYGGKLP
jgi:anti-anti-sigma factor